MNLPIQSKPVNRRSAGSGSGILESGLTPSCPPGSWSCTDGNGKCACVNCPSKTIFGTCASSCSTTCGTDPVYKYCGGDC